MKPFLQPPEAIILTMPVCFFRDRIGNPTTWYYSNDRSKYWKDHTPDTNGIMKLYMKEFAEYFQRFMANPNNTWHFKKKQLPTTEVAWIYLLWDGKIQFRLNFVMYERNKAKKFSDSFDGKIHQFPKTNWIILSGPAIKAPHDIPMQGFQGHRYTEKLF